MAKAIWNGKVALPFLTWNNKHAELVEACVPQFDRILRQAQDASTLKSVEPYL